MPTNATISAVVGYLTLIATGLDELFKWQLDSTQQQALVAIIGAVTGLAALAYAGLVHHTAAKVVVAKLTADGKQPVFATSSGAGVTYTTTATTAAPVDPKVVAAVRDALVREARKRPSRAKPKTPPAV